MDGFTGELYQMLIKELILILNKLFQKVEMEHFPTHSMRQVLTQIPKPNKHITRELQTDIPYKYRYIVFYKILAKPNQWLIKKRIIHNDQVRLIPRM